MLLTDDCTKSLSNTGEQIFTTVCLLSSSHVLFPFVILPARFFICPALFCIHVRASESVYLSFSLLVSVVSATSVCHVDLPVGIFSGADCFRSQSVDLNSKAQSLFASEEAFHSISRPYKVLR